MHGHLDGRHNNIYSESELDLVSDDLGALGEIHYGGSCRAVGVGVGVG
jgi:hypothetical protein